MKSLKEQWPSARQQCNRNAKPDALASQNYFTSKQRDSIGLRNKPKSKYNRNERIREKCRQLQHNLCYFCHKPLGDGPLIIHHIEKDGKLIEVLIHSECSHKIHGHIFY